MAKAIWDTRAQNKRREKKQDDLFTSKQQNKKQQSRKKSSPRIYKNKGINQPINIH